MKKKEKIPFRRSCCPVSAMLDIVGDKWTMLIVRDLILGRSRFKEFCASPEKIPTNILSNRLERLLENRIIEQFTPSESPGRKAYRLTPKGEDLKPTLKSMRDWGLKWEAETRIGI